MRVNEKHLRRLIREAISAADARERFGNVLFGTDREKDEEDTPEEADLARVMKRWFSGRGLELDAERVKTFKDLKSTGLYSDVLDTPHGVKTVHRVIFINSQSAFDSLAGDPYPLRSIMGLNDLERKLIKLGSIEVRKIRGGTTHELGLGGYTTSTSASSWSTNDAASVEFHKKQFAKGVHRGAAYLRANLSENQEAFIFNPDEMRPLVGPYVWQYETLQVAPSVKLSGGFVVWAAKLPPEESGLPPRFNIHEAVDSIAQKVAWSTIRRSLQASYKLPKVIKRTLNDE